MGKAEEELEREAVPGSPEPPIENAVRRCPSCRSVGRFVSVRCVAVLLLGFAVLLSAVFWLPPFFRRGSAAGGPIHDPQYGADIVASFILQKPTSLVDANIARLQYDIFDEIGVPNTTVTVIYLEHLGINSTNVVFGVWLYPKNSRTSTALSILKSSLSSLVLRQTSLHLTMPLFGNSYFFQILKFPGDYHNTIAKGFLLQKENMVLNFTLNFPIYQVEDKVGELKDQLKLGLHLKSYEILFVRLTNIRGSTVAPPTVVETFMVLAVGNTQPSAPRSIYPHSFKILLAVASPCPLIQLPNPVQAIIVPMAIIMCTIMLYIQHLHLPPGPCTLRLHLPHLVVAMISQVNQRKPQIVPVAAPAPLQHLLSSQPNGVVPSSSPPSPSPNVHPKSRIPAVIFGHAKPPDHATDIGSPERITSNSPSASSSFEAGKKQTLWAIVFLVYLIRL
ncbi:hypothetical protein HPP92_001659 [Vanilla planifolia]|uniref:DUF7036 domain-containing protein n=1 Tax=Vanilla planifolia TaxID=51239 RepID=A0A835S3V0_VANPL|nr:hypothetical protein HPP92_001659 [Vanilla planifolia]